MNRLRLALVLFLCPSGLAAQLDWHFNPPKIIPARSRHAMAFDAARGRTILFGGYDGSAQLQDTWIWDGDNWRPAGNKTLPPRRSQHALAYDEARKVCILFGGVGPAGVLGDTWEWNGTDWKKMSPTTSPPARFAHAMAYDPTLRRVVVFGGFDGRSFLDDHWEWDGTNWTKRSLSKRPSARAAHAMAYDPVRKRLVLFGGSSGFSNYFDTWEFDGKAWTAAAPSASPPAREAHSMAYDPNLAKILLFGGWNRRTPLRDLWSWNGTTWTQINLSGSYPTAREAFTLTVDTTRKRFVLFGGFGTSTNLGDTWEWDGKYWVNYFGLTFPKSASSGNHLFFNNTTKKIEYIGYTSNRKNDWLVLEEGYWRSNKKTLPTSLPQDSYYCFNNNSGKVFQYYSSNGGSSTIYSFNGTKWTKDWYSSAPYVYGGKHTAAISDPFGPGILKLGGYFAYYSYAPNSNQIYRWTGKSWTKLGPLFTPGPRHGLAMAFDHLKKEIFVLSGQYGTSATPLRETLAYNPTQNKWINYTGPTTMPARLDHRIWWHPFRQRIMVFGGKSKQSSSTLLNDLWEWNGKTWTNIRTKTIPPGRAEYSFAVNPYSGKIVIVGGKVSKSQAWDLWELYDPSIADFLTFGTGCKGTAGVPRLEADGTSRPWLGETFKTVTKNCPAVSGFALTILGFSKDKWAMGKLPADLSPVGMTGCKLWISPDILLPTLNNAGSAPWSIPLPKDATLKGKRFYLQTLVFDTKANPKGITASNAGEAVLGSRR